MFELFIIYLIKIINYKKCILKVCKKLKKIGDSKGQQMLAREHPAFSDANIIGILGALPPFNGDTSPPLQMNPQ